MNEYIYEIVLFIVPFLAALVFGIPPVRAYFLSARSKAVRQAVEIVYMAVKNFKRQYEKETGSKPTYSSVSHKFENLVSGELEKRGIKPDKKTIEQARLYAEALHAELKSRMQK